MLIVVITGGITFVGWNLCIASCCYGFYFIQEFITLCICNKVNPKLILNSSLIETDETVNYVLMVMNM